MLSLKRSLARIAAGLFCLSFAGVFLAGLLRGELSLGSWWAWALLAVLLLLWVRHGSRLVARCTERTFRLLFWGLAALLLALMLAAGFLLLNDHTVSPFDTEAVYRTALDLAQGRIPAEYNDYFVTCENNLFCTLLLAAVYRVVYLLGGALVPGWGMGLNAVCLWLAALFTALCAKRVWGRSAALLALLASFFFLPYYIFTPFLYTDPMGAPFVAGAILLAVRLEQTWADRTLRARLLGAAALGAAAAAAGLMKGSALLLLAAVPLWLWLRGRVICKKQALLALAAAALGFLAVWSGFKAFVHHGPLFDFSAYDAYHMPLTHWVMMGLENDGAFNNESFSYSGSYPTVALREQAIARRIGSDLRHLTQQPVALAWLAATKTATTWLDGSYSCGEAAALAPAVRTALSEWALPDGAHYRQAMSFCQSFYLLLWAGAFVSAGRFALGRPSSGRGFCLLPILCLLGNLCFFLVWECNARYTFVFSCCLFWLLIGALADLAGQGETT